MREIREAYNAVFEKLFDAGVFERKAGTLELAIRNTPLRDEKKHAIGAVFTNWGLLRLNIVTSPEELSKARDTLNEINAATEHLRTFLVTNFRFEDVL